MRIGVYVSNMASERGHEVNVSGHIQLPLHSIRLLGEAGHEVHLITNTYGPDRVLPVGIPEDVKRHLVADGRRRPDLSRGAGDTPGIRVSSLLQQLRQIRRVARDEKLDVLHVFGLTRSAMLGGALRSIGAGPVVVTLVAGNLPAQPGLLTRRLFRRCDAVLTATRHAAAQCERLGVRPRIVRHGIVRDLAAEARGTTPGPRHRVLFWRDASPANGGDVCVAAFERLAPENPDVSFDLALRPARAEVAGIDDLAERHDNVHLHRFPYPDGVDLPRLVAESLLIVLPFRKLTVDPQLAVAESLAAGVAVITTDVRSNGELVHTGTNGAIVPPGEVEPVVSAVRALLADRPALLETGRRTAEAFARDWNWERYVDDIVAVYRDVTTR